MFNKNIQFILSTFAIFIVLVSPTHANIGDAKTITIASWNLKDFGGKVGGVKKPDDTIIVNAMTSIIQNSQLNTHNADIIFVQEIADIQNGVCPYAANHNIQSFNKLCNALGTNYSCSNTPVIISDPFNCEAYGVIYKNNIRLEAIKDTFDTTTNPFIGNGNGNVIGRMIRPPMKAIFSFPSEITKKITFYNVHAKFTGGSLKDLTTFDQKIRGVSNPSSQYMQNEFSKQNVIALGDFNADCAALPKGFTKANARIFPITSWYHVIRSQAETGDFESGDQTNFFSDDKTSCAYDRIMLNKNAQYLFHGLNNRHIGYEFFQKIAIGTNPLKNFNIVRGTSGEILTDHQYIMAALNLGGISTSDGSGNVRSSFNASEKIYFMGKRYSPTDNTNPPITTNFYHSLSALPTDQQNLTNTTRGETIINYEGNIKVTYVKAAPAPNSSIIEYLVLDLNNNGIFDEQVDSVTSYTVTNNGKYTFFTKLLKILFGQTVIDKSSDSSSNLAVSGTHNTNMADNNASGSVLGKRKRDGQTQTLSNNVTFNNDGTFNAVADMSKLTSGLYNLEVDYNVNNGAVTGNILNLENFAPDNLVISNKAEFIIVDSVKQYNDLVTIGDDGLERENFNTARAEYIYLLAKNITPKTADKTVDVYIVSDKLLHNSGANPDWSANINSLQTISVGNQTGYSTPVPTFSVGSNNMLFAAIWHTPRIAFDDPFADKYGQEFNIVIDVDRDGNFTPGTDQVDIHPIKQIEEWFNNPIKDTSDRLDSGSYGFNAIQAIGQYQRFLNSKLNLPQKLDVDGKYGPQTEAASQQFSGSTSLTKQMLPMLKNEALIGFKIMQPQEYHSNSQMSNISNDYGIVDFDGTTTINDDSYSSINADNVTLGDFNIGTNSAINISSNQLKLNGKITTKKSSQLILSSYDNEINGTINAAGGVYITPPQPVKMYLEPSPSQKIEFFGPVIINKGAKLSFHDEL